MNATATAGAETSRSLSPSASSVAAAAAASLALALALALAIALALAVTSRRCRRSDHLDADEAVRRSESAPISRRGSFSVARYASAERLTRPSCCHGNRDGLPGNATVRVHFSGRLHAADDVLFLHEFSADVLADRMPSRSQLLVDVSVAPSGGRWLRLGRAVAPLTKKSKTCNGHAGGGGGEGDHSEWRGEAVDEVVSVQRPHSQFVLLSASIVDLGLADSPIFNAGSAVFNAGMANQPTNRFTVTLGGNETKQPQCPRLLCSLQFLPRQPISSLRVRLGVVNDAPAEATAVTATLTTLIDGETAGKVSLKARRLDAGVHAFNEEVELPIDSAEVRTSGLTVSLATIDDASPHRPNPIGSIRFGGFASANGAPMHHWNEAMRHPNRWLHIVHYCK